MKNLVLNVDSLGPITVVTKGVNSDLVTKEVITFTHETLNNAYFDDFSQEHDRNSLVQYVEHFFELLQVNNIVEQFDVIFDKRNNSRSDMNAGKFAVESVFKQKNCLNYTSVKFLIGGKK